MPENPSARRERAIFGTDWTPDRVGGRLIAVFRALPNTPIYSPRKGVFEPSRPIDGLDLITAVQLCLGRESLAARRLLEWARMRGMGQSIREFVRDHREGKRSSLYAQRRRALERIATFLNEQRAGNVVALAPLPDKSADVRHEAKHLIRVLPASRVLIAGDG